MHLKFKQRCSTGALPNGNENNRSHTCNFKFSSNHIKRVSRKTCLFTVFPFPIPIPTKMSVPGEEVLHLSCSPLYPQHLKQYWKQGIIKCLLNKRSKEGKDFASTLRTSLWITAASNLSSTPERLSNLEQVVSPFEGQLQSRKAALLLTASSCHLDVITRL